MVYWLYSCEDGKMVGEAGIYSSSCGVNGLYKNNGS